MNILKKNLSKIPGLKKLYFFYKIEREFKNFVNKQQHYNNHILIYKYKINSDSIDIFLNKADIRSYLVSLHKQDHKISLFKDYL